MKTDDLMDKKRKLTESISSAIRLSTWIELGYKDEEIPELLTDLEQQILSSAKNKNSPFAEDELKVKITAMETAISHLSYEEISLMLLRAVVSNMNEDRQSP